MNIEQNLAVTVQAFFDDESVAGLLLPDGWFGGRPMETHHQLTFVTARPKRLLIELDDHVLLSFSGAPRVERTTSDVAMFEGTPTARDSGLSTVRR